MSTRREPPAEKPATTGSPPLGSPDEATSLGSGSIRFKTGPLKGKPGTHEVYGNGDHGITIRMTPGAAGDYTCSS